MRQGIELLAPARTVESGKEAIKHGADAVYIGSMRFGARAAATNSVEEIASLTAFAHLYGAKVYVTLNTILQDNELEEARQLVWNLYNAGTDALLVQDMAFLRMDLPPIPLHASTQMDIRTVEKVKFLSELGFSRVVLARELSLEEIRAIHKACPEVELECFVHGALCVSYSGQCYASQHCFSRSANRGECAQFCRLPFDLTDSEGRLLVQGKHLLSLKDMNRSNSLEELMEAGVCSFKIEGRLKDTAYVKNVTAFYNLRLGEILKRRAEFFRTSEGVSHYTFEPKLEKSFNRGFTEYFLYRREADICSFNTPKSTGEPMGVVQNSGPGWAVVAGPAPYNNGDGLCYFNSKGGLEGLRVNKVENGKLFFHSDGGGAVSLQKGVMTYRNSNAEFERLLSKESATRRISVDVLFEETPVGFAVTYSDGNGFQGVSKVEYAKEPARTPQQKNITAQLSKLGGTIFEAGAVTVNLKSDFFIPSSLLSDMRREAVGSLLKSRSDGYMREVGSSGTKAAPLHTRQLSYTANVLNHMAGSFYSDCGVRSVEPAFEREARENVPVMFCKHCIKYALGWCGKSGECRERVDGPLFLRMSDGRCFRLQFDCAKCEMLVYN